MFLRFKSEDRETLYTKDFYMFMGFLMVGRLGKNPRRQRRFI